MCLLLWYYSIFPSYLLKAWAVDYRASAFKSLLNKSTGSAKFVTRVVLENVSQMTEI
jgi:hypothetical protein